MLAARAALNSLAIELGASLDRLHEIEGLFFPDAPEAPFSLWVAASWAPHREILLKAYLNPQVRGRAAATELLTECMKRLGFADAWESVQPALSFRHDGDEATIVCLDLSNASTSRVKIYVRHHGASLSDIDAVAKLARRRTENDVATFYSILTGGAERFLGKAPITELAFVDPADAGPSEVSLEFPIASYVATDAEARQRILRCLTAFGLSTDAYERAIRAVATRSLDERAGIHSHVTFRRPPTDSLGVRRRGAGVSAPLPISLPESPHAARPRIAVYFASEAYVREPGGA
jgi:hypothetical protein